MGLDRNQVAACLNECRHDLTAELLAFRLSRCRDERRGGFFRMLNREGKPIGTHMSHSGKVNYHTIRCMIECIERLERLQS